MGAETVGPVTLSRIVPVNGRFMPVVSIIIKALNEEAKIAAAVESALAAMAGLDGEVVLADSLSTDRTVEIASRYPVRIVQMTDAADRGCGAGAQLGYQASRGKYIYMMDADMRLRPGFIELAMRELEADAALAGVGGHFEHLNRETLEFRRRSLNERKTADAGETDRLNMGGLYRRSAVEQVGYFADRNLHAFEEFELAVRLAGKGWRLKRLTMTAADHDDHRLPDGKLMLRRWSSGYASGHGELLRAALGKPYFAAVVGGIRLIWLTALVYLWVVTILAIAVSGLSYRWLPTFLVAALPFVVMIVRRRDVRLGLHSVVTWIVAAAAFPFGFLRRRKDPASPIGCRIVAEANGPARIPSRA